MPVVGYEDSYEVSDQGRVRSIDRVVTRKNGVLMPCKGQFMSPFRCPPGNYWTVSLQKNGQRHNRRIHVLVAEAFLGVRPDGLVVCHNSGEKDDNKPSNLRWDTYSQNLQDTIRHGNHHNASKTHCKRGHEFTSENTYLNPASKGRQCRECMKLWR